MENEDTRKALSLVERSAMNEAQLEAYDKFWMSITDQEGFLEARYHKGMAEGLAKGKDKANRENARRMKELGIDCSVISQVTGLALDEIEIIKDVAPSKQ